MKDDEPILDDQAKKYFVIGPAARGPQAGARFFERCHHFIEFCDAQLSQRASLDESEPAIQGWPKVLDQAGQVLQKLQRDFNRLSMTRKRPAVLGLVMFLALAGAARAQNWVVNLTWNAPTSSPDPVAGYNVLRSLSGAGAFAQVNSTLISSVSYTDTTVLNSTNYDYIVESADSAGVESAPSNIASVAVPSGSSPPVPIATVSPLSISFPNQSVGTTSGAAVVTISNTGAAALSITPPPALATGTQFAIASTSCSSSLAAGSSCNVNLTFSPTAAGSFTDMLTLTDNSGGTSGVQQTVSLGGAGVSGLTWILGSRTPPPQNFTCNGAPTGTTASCSATITTTAGQAVAVPISAWVPSGPAPTFNSVSGDTFVHPSGCSQTATQSGKSFYVDLVYDLTPAPGTHTYAWTINTTATGADLGIDIDPVAFSLSSGGAIAFGSCAAVSYPATCAAPASCVSPTPTISGPSNYVLQWAALGNGPSNTPPGAPYTSPSDVDLSNVYGTFVGALNQSGVPPIVWSTVSGNYLAAAAAVFAPAAPCSISSVADSCSPGSAQIGAGSTCTATVSHTGSSCNLAVTWSALHGSISSGGAYTAPAVVPSSGADTITATSVQDGTKFGTATVTVTPAPSTVNSVSVSCSPNSVQADRPSTCFAVVSGTGSFNPAVTWSATYGTVNSSGTYVAPMTIPAGGTDTVTATSVQNGGVSGSVTVTVTPSSGGSIIAAPIAALL